MGVLSIVLLDARQNRGGASFGEAPGAQAAPWPMTSEAPEAGLTHQHSSQTSQVRLRLAMLPIL